MYSHKVLDSTWLNGSLRFLTILSARAVSTYPDRSSDCSLYPHHSYWLQDLWHPGHLQFRVTRPLLSSLSLRLMPLPFGASSFDVHRLHALRAIDVMGTFTPQVLVKLPDAPETQRFAEGNCPFELRSKY
jgi:hypothetical protein